jgi:sarcosine oxidase subunit gamma
MLGHVTSWCRSPNLQAWIALAFSPTGARAWADVVGGIAARGCARPGAGRPFLLSSIPKASGFVADENVFAVGATMAGHYGASASTGVTLAETTFRGRVECAGKYAAPRARGCRALSVRAVASRTFQHRRARGGACGALARPASWLLISSDESTFADFEAKRDALNAAGGALFDVSASRIGWTIGGKDARTVLNKGCPLDFDPRVFVEGMCAQSVFGRVNALFYRRPGAPEYTMLVARSFARDAWRALCLSAAQYGYDVQRPQPF